MNELKVITTLSEALSKAYAADIIRLDIQFNNKKDCFIGHLILGEAHTLEGLGEFSICEDGTVTRIESLKEFLIRTPEIHPEPEGTASEAMEGMKAAVDSLEVPKKPKTEKRPKDRHEKILKLYNQGCTKAKIAEELGIGLSTINYHIQKLRDEGKI